MPGHLLYFFNNVGTFFQSDKKANAFFTKEQRMGKNYPLGVLWMEIPVKAVKRLLLTFGTNLEVILLWVISHLVAYEEGGA